uniref:ATP synthase F0 subunit 8 n=1 Tax=Synergus sp. 1 DYB-20230501 TaxID=3136278 RepID=A0AAU6QDH0_9HYME
MPQMKPMNWLNLMLYFFTLMLITLINLNFFNLKKKKKKKIFFPTLNFYK